MDLNQECQTWPTGQNWSSRDSGPQDETEKYNDYKEKNQTVVPIVFAGDCTVLVGLADKQ